MIVSVGFDLHNPGPTPVVLDSFVATASTSRPLAHFSHGTMQQIPEGKTELVEFRLALANNQLMSQALLLAMSPPDSIRVEGTAWIPNFFGFWTSEKSFQASLPYQTLKGSLQSLFH